MYEAFFNLRRAPLHGCAVGRASFPAAAIENARKTLRAGSSAPRERD